MPANFRGMEGSPLDGGVPGLYGLVFRVVLGYTWVGGGWGGE